MRKDNIFPAHCLQVTILGIMLTLFWSDANTAPDKYGCELRTIVTSYVKPTNVDGCPIQGDRTLIRSYILCIPPTLRAQPVAGRQAVPLVLALHGGSDASEIANGTTFRDRVKFEERGVAEGFITAYPNACRVNAGAVICDGGNWNTQSSPPMSTLSDLCQINDVGFIVNPEQVTNGRVIDDGVIADANSIYPVKMDKVLAFGHSLGGMLAYSLACDQPSKFAAIGVTAATRTDATCTPASTSGYPALFHVHNLQDVNVPFFGGGKAHIWPPVEPGLQFLAGKNGCVLPTEDHDFSEAMCLEANCQSRSAELCLLGTDVLDALGDRTDASGPHRYPTYNDAFNANQGRSIGNAFLDKFLP
ncbi:MAG TPA: hypothetical protein P5102_09125 [Candidatus Competibacteraceae bacterium]|nr:hypothetical protein [Candidatus Competibacteraceae bacterium]HRZ06296.1 hypothetical protein [Candidatus Competibacteraceae bacterium]HSA45299.1 hypothetical protein [Candidatus Competibacteraceae bacterium]